MHHAAVVLAIVENARVYPGSVPAAAVEAFNRAHLRRPYEFDPIAAWPVPDTHATGGGDQ